MVLCLVAMGRAQAADRALPRAPKTALIVQAQPGSMQGVLPEFSDLLLGQAVGYHGSGALRMRGDNFRLYMTDTSADRDSCFRSMEEKNFSQVAYLRPMGAARSLKKVVADYHGRRRFVRVGGCLDVVIDCEVFAMTTAGWRSVGSGRVIATSRPYWLYPKGTYRSPAGLDDLVGVAEPYELVIQRAVDDVLQLLPPTPGSGLPVKESLPLHVAISDSILAAAGDSVSWLETMLQAASGSFAEQFGRGLQAVSYDTLTWEGQDGGGLRDYMKQMRPKLRRHGDALVVAVKDRLSVGDYYGTRSRTRIGMARLGRRQVVFSLVPELHGVDDHWRSYYDGLVLLHEIGHTLGAVHVSDAHSVMNHSVSWLGSDRYDPFNRRIIQAALRGELTFDDPAEYLRFISQLLSDSDYRLVDFPEFLDSYLAYGDNERIADRLRRAVGHRGLLLGADGHRALVAGQVDKAAELFRAAIREAPEQASLYYYLAMATSGDESRWARQTAARMGFLKAQLGGESFSR